MNVVVSMSTYNGKKYLRDQIDLILNQVGKFDLHILVRDDGSNNSTLQILNEYQKRKFLQKSVKPILRNEKFRYSSEYQQK